MNYYFDDFTENNYRQILKLAKKKYTFVSYKKFMEEETENREQYKKILWRHDIDFSIHRGGTLSRIEKEEGVHSIYFIHFNSKFYNVFEKEVCKKLIEIYGNGQSIGIHLDWDYYDDIPTDSQIEEDLVFYKNVLKKLTGIEAYAFSFHNPTAVTFEKFDNIKYAGLINVYSKEIMQRVEYCSDSNGYWRFQRLLEFLERDDIQNACVLTHPGWWVPTAMSPRERIERAIAGRSACVASYYEAVLENVQRVNVK